MSLIALAQSAPSLQNLAAALIIGGILFALLEGLIGARCSAMIREWASHSGWDVVARKRVFFGGGPFAFSPGMPVYELELENTAGRRRRAFVRCGDAITSVLSDHIAVEWADC
jgi:hypothetical protein